MIATRPQAGGYRPERDLVAAIRAELAAIEPARRCCRVAERAGLGSAAQGQARSPLIGRLAVRLEDPTSSAPFDWGPAAEHCRLAYLRGHLLARGSLSLGPSGTHLEVVVPAAELATLAGQFAELDLAPGVRLRRGQGVLTWKGGPLIVDLLRRVGASAATLEIESRFVGRALRGHLNRVVNGENANLGRAVAAARRQLADIEALERRGELRRLSRVARRVARARRHAPEATFAELAATLELSRAQVQRAFAAIETATLHDVDREA
jgi:hypothetical protein